MRNARLALAGVCVAVVAVLAALAEAPSGIPFVLIQQGVNLRVVDGHEVFVMRQGSVVQAFPRTVEAAGGDQIVYCPGEEAFVAPEDTSLWNARGEFVAGPAGVNLPEYPTRLDEDLILHVDVSKVRRTGTTRGQISGEAGERYSLFRAGDGFAEFCQGPIPAIPSAVPTPSS